MRIALYTAALLLAGCGDSRSEATPELKADPVPGGPRCDPAALVEVRRRMTAAHATPFKRPDYPPMAFSADGDGRTDGAVIIRFYAEQGEVHVAVGIDSRTWPAAAPESVAGVVEAAAAKLPRAQTKVFEIDGFSALAADTLITYAQRLHEHGEVRLLVNRVHLPPRDGVAAWATELVDEVMSVRGDNRSKRLIAARARALGPTCAAAYDARVRESGRPSAVAVMRVVLPDALEDCGCDDADVATAAWIHELLNFPAFQWGWLRLHVEPGGVKLYGVRDTDEVAGALEAATAEERQNGVWFVP